MKAKVNGQGDLVDLTISPAAIDATDPAETAQTIADLVLAAVRDANRAAGELQQEKMGPLAEAWRPWRGAAACMLWTYYRAAKQRGQSKSATTHSVCRWQFIALARDSVRSRGARQAHDVLSGIQAAPALRARTIRSGARV